MGIPQFQPKMLGKGAKEFKPSIYFGDSTIKNLTPFLSFDSKKSGGKKNLSNLKDYRDWIKGL
jgi:hypothetical protein